MIQKSLFLSLSFLFTCSFAYSQEIIPCLYDHAVHLSEMANPGYKDHLYRTIESVADKSINRNDDIYKIKVVFHVVYKNDNENVPEEALNNQIKVLNECYRRQNSDTSNLRAIFEPVAADTGIEFEIDEIRRVKTTASFEPSLTGLPDEVKQTSKGGSDAKDPDKYLNIWVCQILPINIFGFSSPVLGYAYPPDNLPHWPEGSAASQKGFEGVVLDYRTVKDKSYTIPNFGSIPMEGRTAVHEVGHYLGLRHISGDGGLFGINCEGTDGVDDTPTQGKQSDFNCDKNQNTCGAGQSGDLPDMIENYMDYSAESCQNTFTKGQTAIMRGVLQTLRKGLLHTTNVDDLAADTTLEIVPNPANQHFYIKGPDEYKHYKIVVFDMLGQQILNREVKNYTEVNVSEFNPGMYLVKINDHQVKKLMIGR